MSVVPHVDELTTAVYGTFRSTAELGRDLNPANVVDALFEIARELSHIAIALERLGTNNASTPMGGLEVVSLAIKEGLEEVAASVLAASTHSEP